VSGDVHFANLSQMCLPGSAGHMYQLVSSPVGNGAVAYTRKVFPEVLGVQLEDGTELSAQLLGWRDSSGRQGADGRNYLELTCQHAGTGGHLLAALRVEVDEGRSSGFLKYDFNIPAQPCPPLLPTS
jgi:hypothetical protein